MLLVVQEAIAAGCGALSVEHEQGPILVVVVGGARAMVMRLAAAGDAGHHAIELAASLEPSERYTLTNGQVDHYADRDTVDTRHLVPIVTHFLATLDRWPGVPWQNDESGDEVPAG
ncbi:hypothetical protein ABZ783_30445 [Micromonospora sp. NPDC047738]|uniref:hypothetical protein n=1 Tax=Micromonospora sp. NPDC047738 TaxID=3155741 RepID=UPI0033F4A4FE